MAECPLFSPFTATLTRLGVRPDVPFAVAVSGGCDSIALAHLCWRWAQHTGARVVAYTVDHRLRPGSTEEAAQVVAQLADWGMVCRVLTWHAAAAGPGLQERAREARYALLRAAAHEDGIADIMLAHHADDQAETFWMRLADGSGLSGLAAMSACRQQNDITWWRPLLEVTRAQLRSYVSAHNLTVIEDPSNANPHFLRVRLRGFAQALEQEGLTPARLTRTLGKLAEAERALAHIADQMWRQRVRMHPAGALCLDMTDCAAAPRDLRRRLVQRAVMTLSAAHYPPGYDNLIAIADQLTQDRFVPTTLAGCLLRRKGDTLWIMREPAALPPAQPIDAGCADALVWDRRFAVSGLRALAGQGLFLAPLGEAAVPDIYALWPAAWPKAPKTVCAGLPAIWDGEKPVAVAPFGWAADDFSHPLPKMAPALIV